MFSNEAKFYRFFAGHFSLKSLRITSSHESNQSYRKKLALSVVCVAETIYNCPAVFCVLKTTIQVKK
jgi:hypothetical protein